MNQPVDAEIIIIGAGIAGLTAAFTILEKEPSINILILESSGRIGGRTFSVPLKIKDGSYNSHFELGGEFITIEQSELITFLKKFKIPLLKTKPRRGTTILYYQNSTLYAGNSGNEDHLKFLTQNDKLELSKFLVKVEQLRRQLEKAPNKIQIAKFCKMSMDIFLKQNLKSEKARYVVEHMEILFLSLWGRCRYLNSILINGEGDEIQYESTKTSDISVLFYIFLCMSWNGMFHYIPILGDKFRPRYKIQGGTRNILQSLLERIGEKYVIKKDRVINILCNNKYVRVVTQKNSYLCYNVIITVPPSGISRILFDPPLEAQKIGYLKKISRSVAVTIFVITYTKAFWKTLGFSGYIYSFNKKHSGPIYYCYDASDSQKCALSGKIIDNMHIKKEFGNFRHSVLKELSLLFGKEAQYPLDYYEKTWNNVGCCSQMFCWGSDVVAYINVMTKPHERIFWAGAETSKEWYGTIAGAVNSGVRSALQVLYDLRPASITMDDMLIISSTNILRRRNQITQKRILMRNKCSIRWNYYIIVLLSIIIVFCKLKSLLEK